MQRKEVTLLTLHPAASEASEWLDGLLMLLHQLPISPDTSRLLSLVSSWGLKIRLLNVRYDDEEVEQGQRAVPSRDGLDDDYYYDVLNA
jgi:engulfment and cell motility protein 1